ncbi:MAG: hypothetical protein FWC33_04235 [Candidatus Bathyarchaeota archaeon]|nr:hypothetical protein [Candidatus Termiticorpusculum sp.]
MKANAVVDFALQFGVKLVLNEKLLIQHDDKIFLLSSNVKALVGENFFHAGLFLGKVRAGKFFPSFNLLAILAKHEANRIIIDKKASWLFICGRNIFKKSVLRIYGKVHKNCHVLVLNEFGECLGFGRALGGLAQQTDKDIVAVVNVLDVGDFLRRERDT